MANTVLEPFTYYGTDIETYYVDQFQRIWIVQSQDDVAGRPAQQIHEIPSGAEDVTHLVDSDFELPMEVYSLPDYAVAQVKHRARLDAELFVNEFNEPLDPATTDWDSIAFESTRFLFKLDGVYDEVWSLYQSTLVAETERLARIDLDNAVITDFTADALVRLTSWMADVAKTPDFNKQAVLEEVQDQFTTTAGGDFELPGFHTKSGCPETIFFSISDFEWSE